MVIVIAIAVIVVFNVILEGIEIYNTRVIRKKIKRLENDFRQYEKDAANAKVLIEGIKDSINEEASVENVVSLVSQNLLRIEQSIEGLKQGYKELAYEISRDDDKFISVSEVKMEEVDNDIYNGRTPRAGQMSFSDIEEYNKKINEEKPIKKTEKASEDFVVEEIDEPK